MTYLVPAQAGAQLISVAVYALIARWYVVPWLNTLTRVDALTALLWIQVFRYVALQIFAAQRDGFPISDDALLDIVIGDLAGAAIALAAIGLLRHRSRFGTVLAWLLVAETVYDTITNIRGGIHEHLMGAAGGITWMILVFYVPLVVEGLVLLIGQLHGRRHEALDPAVAENAIHRSDAALTAS